MCLYTPVRTQLWSSTTLDVCVGLDVPAVHGDADGSSGRMVVMMMMAIAVAVARVCGNECSGESRHGRGDQYATNTQQSAVCASVR